MNIYGIYYLTELTGGFTISTHSFGWDDLRQRSAAAGVHHATRLGSSSCPGNPQVPPEVSPSTRARAEEDLGALAKHRGFVGR